jgi:hypothetical protein
MLFTRLTCIITMDVLVAGFVLGMVDTMQVWLVVISLDVSLHCLISPQFIFQIHPIKLKQLWYLIIQVH